MPIAYFRQAADQEFWSRTWQREDVGRLVAVADTSFLTKLLIENLPRRGRILEAGCGLGQYVIYLRKQGYKIEGLDYSERAIEACHAFDPGAAVAVGDVRSIVAGDGDYSAYVSLGVVEHDPDGPTEILREAHRVLSEDGVLLLSVPFANPIRQSFRMYVNAKNEAARRDGARFYQYAYTKREVARFLRDSGFDVLKYLPYDPRRLPKQAFRRLFGRRAVKTAGAGSPAPGGGLRESVSRKLFYSRPLLHTFSHMLLVVARKHAGS